MITRYLLLVLFSTLLLGKTNSAPKTRFYIIFKALGDEDKYGKLANFYSGYFESNVFNGLRNTFPCVDLNIESAIREVLSFERQRSLFGVGNDLENIAGAMGYDYLVILTATVNNNQAVLKAVCNDIRKANSIAMVLESAPHGKEGNKAADKVTEKLIDEIAKYEICPYTGKVEVKVTSNLEKNEEEEYGVYCNHKDETYKKKFTLHNHSEMDWQLEKTRLSSASGTVNYNISEETNLVEENGCFRCKSGREGGRTLRERTTTKGKIEGLSNESTQDGLPVDDARISLKFRDDGTYSVVVKATSKQGDLTLIKEAHSEGTCDPVNVATKPIQKKADIGIRDMTFGPFNGTAKDKLLSNQQTINETDPISEEENQYSIEFNLKRD